MTRSAASAVPRWGADWSSSARLSSFETAASPPRCRSLHAAASGRRGILPRRPPHRPSEAARAPRPLPR